MRAFLLNDTRSEDHVGCRLVVRNVLRQCERAGLDVVATIPHSEPDDAAIVRARTGQYDLLLINGEGTMHHDQPKALAMARAAEIASRLGKRVVLFNTVWQSNRELQRYLPYFDLIFCRESLSAAELSAAGREARVVPDMVFATELVGGAMRAAESPFHFDRSLQSGTVVLDCVIRRKTLQWAWRAVLWKYAFMPMHEENYWRLKRHPWLWLGLRLRCKCVVQKPGESFLRDLSRYREVVSGRFHGVCLAMLAGIPVVGIASNTHKIEGLFRDAGLDERAIVATGDLGELREKLAYVASRMASIRSYVAAAPERIRQMFLEIRDLARGRDKRDKRGQNDFLEDLFHQTPLTPEK